MQFWKKSANNNIKENNRINIILAIIFLLGGGLIFRLYTLQVRDYDLYLARAAGQHQVQSVIPAERGRIFVQNTGANADRNGLFPIATNKKYAELFAIPKEMKEPEKIAEILYFTFKEAEVKKEVEETLRKEDQENLDYEFKKLESFPEEERLSKKEEIIKKEEEFRKTKEFIEARKVRIAAEIEKRKKSIIIDYIKAFKKENDPYEPLELKVPEEVLINLYKSIIFGTSTENWNTEFVFKEEKLHIKNNDGSFEKIKIDGLDFHLKTFRFYPEKEIGANMIGFVNYAGDEPRGQYGLEGFFNEELSGIPGYLKTERSAGGALIIVNNRQYTKPINGDDLILTIDHTIQSIACQKLNTAVLKYGADGGSLIIADPKTGAILAMCSSPDYDPNNYREVKNIQVYTNPAVFSQYEPGSIFKALTMSFAIDQEKVTPETVYEDTGSVRIAGYEIKNSDFKAHGIQNMINVLEKSLNTGMIFVMRQIGPEKFTEYIKNFGFGEKTGIELQGEGNGDIRNLILSSDPKNKVNKELYAATASFGQGIAVTPIQMIAAFGALANGGILMKPYIVKEIIHRDGTRSEINPQAVRRVISEKTAAIIGGMLVNVVEQGHGKKAGVKEYYVAGKTGTAQVPRKDGRGYQSGVNIGSFAGFAPVNDPRFVMLVRIDHPRGVIWAESSAAPVFGEMAQFLLNYWQIPTEREIIKKNP